MRAALFGTGDGAFQQGVFAVPAETINIARSVSPHSEMQCSFLQSRCLDKDVVIFPQYVTELNWNKADQSGLVQDDGILRASCGKNQSS